MSDSDHIEVRNWVGFTLSGVAGFLAATVTMTLMFGDLQRDTASALKRADGNADDIDKELRPRIRALEIANAGTIQLINSAIGKIDSLTGDVRDLKALLKDR